MRGPSRSTPRRLRASGWRLLPAARRATHRGAPARLPDTLALYLNSEINQALRQPDVRERLAAIGLDQQSMTQPELAQYMKSEVAKWGQVIKTTGIAPN